MLAEAHRKAAEDIERTIVPLQSQAQAARVVIEGAWGAAFHWIAFGCETKHHQPQNAHARLGRFLRSFGESTVADWWETLDNLRQGGWYGGESDSARVREAVALLADIHS
jgi:hypothetical protein